MGTELTVELTEPGADGDELAVLLDGLRTELLELDVDSVGAVPATSTAAGSKGADMATIGALLVTMQSSIDLTARVVAAVRSWLSRGTAPARSVRLTLNGNSIELSAATAEQQERLIEEFLRPSSDGT